jgi:drug/metabolite transporter (DMT)-like permease
MYPCLLFSDSWASSPPSTFLPFATASTAAVTSATSDTTDHHRRGVALCLLSAAAFGLMAIFAKEAYRTGVSVATLLALRFAFAAGVFWAIVAARRAASTPPAPRAVLAGLALGAIGYAIQAGGYFGALTRIDASLTSLLLYTYPALVFGAALLLGRERADRRRVAALALATAGAGLVLAGGGAGALDPLGVALALSAAVAYSAYILFADRIVGRIDAFLLSALITTGAALSVTAAGLAGGSLDLGFEPAGWAWIAALALVSTVVAASAFLIALPDVGPATASIVSTVEPVVTVAMAMLCFGERLGGVQVAGGALVLAAVVLLAAKVRVRGPAPHTAGAAPARAFATQPARG